MQRYVGYPNSMVVLGDSSAIGENSYRRRPGVIVRANSWATGTNPAVNSLYRRLLAHDPAIRGHNFNLAEPGGTVTAMVREAYAALFLRPKPDLFVIQVMDNDMVCPAAAADLAAFRATFVSALRVIREGAPNASLFVVSQFGSPAPYASLLTAAERQSVGGGTGPCDFIDSTGQIVTDKISVLDAAIHGYEAQLAAGCTIVRNCRYDGGALGNIVDRRDYYSSDLNHLSITGHAKEAAVAWAALKRAGLVPRN